MSVPHLQSFRLKSFKAVQDSGLITFTPLTVFIGNNGSGKSSIIEGLEWLHDLVTFDLNEAVRRWRGFDHILNKAVPHELAKNIRPLVRPYRTNPMSFGLQCRLDNRLNVSYTLEMGDEKESGDFFIKQEKLRQKGQNFPTIDFARDDRGNVTGDFIVDVVQALKTRLPEEEMSLLNLSRRELPYDIPLRTFIQDWQFVSLVAQGMGDPVRERRTGSSTKLEKDGSNIAQYLADIRDRYPSIFEGIVSTLQEILPYARGLQIALTSEIEHALYPQLSEGSFNVPGWLLSTGTLRILALLTLLRHPEPPPLIVIEEIENGLDPLSVNTIVNEIEMAVSMGKTQVIVTTHSPHLLNLVHLNHLVLVERVEGKPVFRRPGDDEQLQKWTQNFALGDLYTSGRLSEREVK